jgi:Polyketide cyclase / dehydrase and lipid transport
MSFVYRMSTEAVPSARGAASNTRIAVLKSIIALSLVGIGASASAATLEKSIIVQADSAAVWSYIGPTCAIKDWLPPVGSCTEDGKAAPTRTLVTKDGTATFVELLTERSDREHRYTYKFLSSPVPVTDYQSTIRVVPNGKNSSTVIWRATYVANQGKEKDANDTLAGIYAAGLDQIKTKFAK